MAILVITTLDNVITVEPGKVFNKKFGWISSIRISLVILELK